MQRAAVTLSKSRKGHGREPVRILLLEDDPQFAELLHAQLRRMPSVESRLEVVGTLAEALAKLPSDSFGLVLADLNLPDSSGLQTLEALCAAAEQPIIVLTGDQNPTLRAGAIERGAYDFVSKDQLDAAALERLMRLACLQANTFRSLRESEARFRSLLALSSDTYWEQDDQYRFTVLSGTGSKWLGTDRNRLLGKQRWDEHCFKMSEADWAAHKALLDARKPFRDLELGRINDSGATVWVSVSGEPVSDEAGVFKGYRGVANDITARKRGEQLLRLEHTIALRLAEADSMSGALQSVIRAICESQGWECGRYFYADEKAGLLRFGEAWGTADAVIERYIAASREATYSLEGASSASKVRAWRTREAVWTSQMGRQTHLAQSILGGARDSFAFAVISEGRAIGVLSFTSRDVRQPDARLLQAARVIGAHIGQFLQRKQGEHALRDSESRFRSLTALSSDWYWEQDEELRFTRFEGRINEVAKQAIGRRRWEIAGITPISGTWEEHRRALEARQPFRDFEYLVTGEDGGLRYTSVSGEPVTDAEGRFKGYRGVARDITPRKRAEDDLRRFRTALDSSADMVLLMDMRDTKLLDFNDTTCLYLGYSREELLGHPASDIHVDRPLQELLDGFARLLASAERSDTAGGTYRRKDGSTFPVELRRNVIETRQGPMLVINARDLTERRRAEQHQADHLRYQKKIARFGRSALGKREPAEMIEEAVQIVLEGVRADAVAYLEPGAGEHQVLLRAVVGLPQAPDAALAQYHAGGSLAAALERGESVVVDDVARDGTTLPYAWTKESKSAALHPVRARARVHGVLCAVSRRAAAFGAEETRFLDAAASVLSAGLGRIESETRLVYLAQYDPLTGLPNRTLLADRFSQTIVQAKRRGSPLAVLFIDLDEFKMVNDTLGHAGGDALLKEVAVRLQSTVRAGDTVARISGDEFAIVLSDLARPDDAALVAQKVIDRLAATVDIAGKEVFVTASVGIAAFPGDGADAESLIGAADAAMYRAKQSGRNGYQFYTAEINQRSRARAQMAAELRRALEREEFTLFYQPKVDLTSRRATGAEALLRWKHPERGLVSPIEFIPVLEETGLIVAVGGWVIRRACEDLKAFPKKLPIAINLSARQFRQPDLHQRIKALVEAAGIDPALIELEITESQLMQDPEHAIRVMRALCEAGVRLAIDDFGTGYSSLAYLTRFPVSALKIDRSFVKDMASDSADATIVRTIIEMAHTLGFTVVAEGVETEEQATFLRLLRCEEAQGFLFARPMSVEQFVTFCGQ